MIQCVILKPRVFSGGAKDLARTTTCRPEPHACVPRKNGNHLKTPARSALQIRAMHSNSARKDRGENTSCGRTPWDAA